MGKSVLSLLLYALVTEYDIIELAASQGFFYRHVSITTGASCHPRAFCLTVEGVTYRLDRLDTTEVCLTEGNKRYTLTITPDPSFSAYRLFVRDAATVRRIEITKRSTTVLDGGTLISLQVVAVGAHGPVVVWQKDVRSAPPAPWLGDLVSTINGVRQKAGAPPLTVDVSLRQTALKKIGRIQAGSLAHYDGREGSIAHSRLRTASIGENLFMATTIEKAWHMMYSSPSHLFNILSPSFHRCWIETAPAQEGLTAGIVVFAE